MITIILLFTINTSLSKTDTVRTDSSYFLFLIDDCLTDRVFQKLREPVKMAAKLSQEHCSLTENNYVFECSDNFIVFVFHDFTSIKRNA